MKNKLLFIKNNRILYKISILLMVVMMLICVVWITPNREEKKDIAADTNYDYVIYINEEYIDDGIVYKKDKSDAKKTSGEISIEDLGALGITLEEYNDGIRMTLKDVNFNTSADCAINIEDVDATIVIEGENNIGAYGSGDAAVITSGDMGLTFEGTGILNISSDDSIRTGNIEGIYSGNVTINSGTININIKTTKSVSGKESSVSGIISSEDALKIIGGSVNINIECSDDKYGVSGLLGEVLITGGKVDIDLSISGWGCGIEGEDSVEVNGGNIDIKITSASESIAIFVEDGTYTQNAGIVNLTMLGTTNDEEEKYGIQANKIEIKDGIIISSNECSEAYKMCDGSTINVASNLLGISEVKDYSGGNVSVGSNINNYLKGTDYSYIRIEPTYYLTYRSGKLYRNDTNTAITMPGCTVTSGKIVLDGFYFSTLAEYGLYSEETVTIELAEGSHNTISVNNVAGSVIHMAGNGQLTLDGKGHLELNSISERNTYSQCGISTWEEIHINNCSLDINIEGNALNMHAIYTTGSEKNIYIDNANVNIKCLSNNDESLVEVIYALEGGVSISETIVYIETTGQQIYTFNAQNSIDISSSEVTCTVASDFDDSFISGVFSDGTLNINDTDIEMQMNGGDGSAGIFARNEINIEESSILINGNSGGSIKGIGAEDDLLSIVNTSVDINIHGTPYEAEGIRGDNNDVQLENVNLKINVTSESTDESTDLDGMSIAGDVDITGGYLDISVDSSNYAYGIWASGDITLINVAGLDDKAQTAAATMNIKGREEVKGIYSDENNVTIQGGQIDMSIEGIEGVGLFSYHKVSILESANVQINVKSIYDKNTVIENISDLLCIQSSDGELIIQNATFVGNVNTNGYKSEDGYYYGNVIDVGKRILVENSNVTVKTNSDNDCAAIVLVDVDNDSMFSNSNVNVINEGSNGEAIYIENSTLEIAGGTTIVKGPSGINIDDSRGKLILVNEGEVTTRVSEACTDLSLNNLIKTPTIQDWSQWSQYAYVKIEEGINYYFQYNVVQKAMYKVSNSGEVDTTPLANGDLVSGWKIEDGKLILEGFNFVTSAECGIDVVGNADIVVEGNNSIETKNYSVDNYGIKGNSNLSFTGDGTLNIRYINNNYVLSDNNYVGIYATGNINITGGTYTINTQEIYSTGIEGDIITVDNSELNIIITGEEIPAIYAGNFISRDSNIDIEATGSTNATAVSGIVAVDGNCSLTRGSVSINILGGAEYASALYGKNIELDNVNTDISVISTNSTYEDIELYGVQNFGNVRVTGGTMDIDITSQGKAYGIWGPEEIILDGVKGVGNTPAKIDIKGLTEVAGIYAEGGEVIIDPIDTSTQTATKLNINILEGAEQYGIYAYAGYKANGADVVIQCVSKLEVSEVTGIYIDEGNVNISGGKLTIDLLESSWVSAHGIHLHSTHSTMLNVALDINIFSKDMEYNEAKGIFVCIGDFTATNGSFNINIEGPIFYVAGICGEGNVQLNNVNTKIKATSTDRDVNTDLNGMAYLGSVQIKGGTIDIALTSPGSAYGIWTTESITIDGVRGIDEDGKTVAGTIDVKGTTQVAGIFADGSEVSIDPTNTDVVTPTNLDINILEGAEQYGIYVGTSYTCNGADISVVCDSKLAASEAYALNVLGGNIVINNNSVFTAQLNEANWSIGDGILLHDDVTQTGNMNISNSEIYIDINSKYKTDGYVGGVENYHGAITMENVKAEIYLDGMTVYAIAADKDVIITDSKDIDSKYIDINVTGLLNGYCVTGIFSNRDISVTDSTVNVNIDGAPNYVLGIDGWKDVESIDSDIDIIFETTGTGAGGFGMGAKTGNVNISGGDVSVDIKESNWNYVESIWGGDGEIATEQGFNGTANVTISNANIDVKVSSKSNYEYTDLNGVCAYGDITITGVTLHIDLDSTYAAYGVVGDGSITLDGVRGISDTGEDTAATIDVNGTTEVMGILAYNNKVMIDPVDSSVATTTKLNINVLEGAYQCGISAATGYICNGADINVSCVSTISDSEAYAITTKGNVLSIVGGKTYIDIKSSPWSYTSGISAYDTNNSANAVIDACIKISDEADVDILATSTDNSATVVGMETEYNSIKIDDSDVYMNIVGGYTLSGIYAKDKVSITDTVTNISCDSTCRGAQVFVIKADRDAIVIDGGEVTLDMQEAAWSMAAGLSANWAKDSNGVKQYAYIDVHNADITINGVNTYTGCNIYGIASEMEYIDIYGGTIDINLESKGGVSAIYAVDKIQLDSVQLTDLTVDGTGMSAGLLSTQNNVSLNNMSDVNITILDGNTQYGIYANTGIRSISSYVSIICSSNQIKATGRGMITHGGSIDIDGGQVYVEFVESDWIHAAAMYADYISDSYGAPLTDANGDYIFAYVDIDNADIDFVGVGTNAASDLSVITSYGNVSVTGGDFDAEITAANCFGVYTLSKIQFEDIEEVNLDVEGTTYVTGLRTDDANVVINNVDDFNITTSAITSEDGIYATTNATITSSDVEVIASGRGSTTAIRVHGGESVFTDSTVKATSSQLGYGVHIADGATLKIVGGTFEAKGSKAVNALGTFTLDDGGDMATRLVEASTKYKTSYTSDDIISYPSVLKLSSYAYVKTGRIPTYYFRYDATKGMMYKVPKVGNPVELSNSGELVSGWSISGGKLVLDGFDFKTTAFKIIDVVGDATISVEGTNTLTSVDHKNGSLYYGIYASDSLSIIGTDTSELNIISRNYDYDTVSGVYTAVNAKDKIIITNGTYNIDIQDNALYGIEGEKIEIYDASVNINANAFVSGMGIVHMILEANETSNDMIINNTNIELNINALEETTNSAVGILVYNESDTKGNISITGGSVDVNTEGYAAMGIYTQGNVGMDTNNTSITVDSKLADKCPIIESYGIPIYGIFIYNDISIGSGSTVTVNTDSSRVDTGGTNYHFSEAICSGGDIAISDATVTATTNGGSLQGNCSRAICCGQNATINNSTVTAYATNTVNGSGYGIYANTSLDVINSTFDAKGDISAIQVDTEGGSNVKGKIEASTTTGGQLVEISDVNTNFTRYKRVKVIPALLSVNITWGDMDFITKASNWNPSKFAYDTYTWTPSVVGGDKITISNSASSNKSVSADVKFNTGGAYSNITGSILSDKTNKTPFVANTPVAVGTSIDAYLALEGSLAVGTMTHIIGNVTVTLAN